MKRLSIKFVGAIYSLQPCSTVNISRGNHAGSGMEPVLR